jgi:methionine aminotransferase
MTLLTSKLPDIGTTIFAVMTQLANRCGAYNLSQGFPDFNVKDQTLEEAAEILCKI